MNTSIMHHRMQDPGLPLLDHEGEFKRAWADPNNTRLELPPVDVNRVLAEHYRTSEPFTFHPHHAVGHGGAEGMEARLLYPLRCKGGERPRLGPAFGGRRNRILRTVIAAAPLA